MQTNVLRQILTPETVIDWDVAQKVRHTFTDSLSIEFCGDALKNFLFFRVQDCGQFFEVKFSISDEHFMSIN
jgi:hypothetical protein